jgi:hypothetical protein
VTENQLFVAAFGAFNPNECAAWFGNKFVPFTHNHLFLLLSNRQLAQTNALFVTHVTANFAFQAQSLFLGGFGEFFLQRETLSTVAFFFAGVVAFAFSHSAAFTCFVQGHSVSLMLLAFGAVRRYFFRNVHVFTFQRTNKNTASSYTFSAFLADNGLFVRFDCAVVLLEERTQQLYHELLAKGLAALHWSSNFLLTNKKRRL